MFKKKPSLGFKTVSKEKASPKGFLTLIFDCSLSWSTRSAAL